MLYTLYSTPITNAWGIRFNVIDIHLVVIAVFSQEAARGAPADEVTFKRHVTDGFADIIWFAWTSEGMAATKQERLERGRVAAGAPTPPEGGWGWMIVIGCFLATICTRAVTRWGVCVSLALRVWDQLNALTLKLIVLKSYKITYYLARVQSPSVPRETDGNTCCEIYYYY